MMDVADEMVTESDDRTNTDEIGGGSSTHSDEIQTTDTSISTAAGPSESSNEMDVSTDDHTHTGGETTSTGSGFDSEGYSEFDIGKWIGKSSEMSANRKIEMMNRCWAPHKTYDFKDDAKDQKRIFKHDWLEQYAPWLAYSKMLKGALCLHCVLFPPPMATVQGVLGAFIVSAFTKYKDLHDACKNHATNQWHRNAIKTAISLKDDIPVDIQLKSGHEKAIAENRKVFSNIVSTVIFCGVHDIALRGKKKNQGNLSNSFIEIFH